MEKIFKVILIIVAMLAFVSCGEFTEKQYQPTTNDHGVTYQRVDNYIEKLTIEGHDYFKFFEVGAYGTNIAVVHSASCPASHEYGRLY